MNDYYPLIIIGGGLSGGLLAYRISQLQPQLSFLLIEELQHLGGNHTWSFHSTDLSTEQFSWISPLISKSWKNYQVEFPSFRRIMSIPYHSIRSEHFHQVLVETLGDRICFNQKVREVEPHSLILFNEKKLFSECIIDARGPNEYDFALAGGFQKFVGIDIELEEDHAIPCPVLMDATCVQEDGFRFFYILPWSEKKLLIEDTRYSENSDLDLQKMLCDLTSYIHSKGWKIKSIERKETGVLSIPFQSPFKKTDPIFNEIPTIGSKRGFFHATTGYSLNQAVQVAEQLSRLPNLNQRTAHFQIKELLKMMNKRTGFYCFLNRMLFQAATPKDRFKVLERFYKLPEDLVHRFYANQLNFLDCARILLGKPPVPIGKAIKCLFSS